MSIPRGGTDSGSAGLYCSLLSAILVLRGGRDSGSVGLHCPLLSLSNTLGWDGQWKCWIILLFTELE